MITFKELKQIVLLSESGVGDDVIGKIFNVNPKKIKKYFLKGKKIFSKEIDEDTATTGSGGGGSAGTTAPAGPSNIHKWTGAAEGRANPRTPGKKWESGVNRGPANQLS